MCIKSNSLEYSTNNIQCILIYIISILINLIIDELEQWKLGDL